MSIHLEVIGLSLTVVEIYFPKKSVKLEEWIDTLTMTAPSFLKESISEPISKKLYNMAYRIFTNNPDDTDNIDEPPPSMLELIVVLIGLLVGLGIFALFLYFLDKPSSGLPYIFFGLYIIGTLLIIITIFLKLFIALLALSIKITVHSLNFITRGRAVGAIGLIIAIIGLLGNI